jgi:hypothetical protein
MAEGEGVRLELQLPASIFFPSELLFYVINKCRLFITKEWLEYNIFNYNLFLRRQQGLKTNIEN